MLNIHELFEVPDFEKWKELLKKDLSTEDFDQLTSIDPVEELTIVSATHASMLIGTSQLPGNFPYTRGFNKKDNEWSVGTLIVVTSEQNANQKALDLLMKGADLLIFDLPKETVDLKTLLQEIGLEYIDTQFCIHSLNQWQQLQNYFNKEIPSHVKINLDPLKLTKPEIQEIATSLKFRQSPVFSIKGHKLIDSGAASFQEIAFCLSAGHYLLFTLLEAGLTVDEALACIHFSTGIGANYFIEIAKFRALRTLWSNVVDSYSPEHACSYHCHITAHTSSLNKSLKDPYTNLLRQTTEAISAVAGGVQGLVIYPYDFQSVQEPSALSERMALNISLLLKEESHLNAVNDPLGGSYSVELLTKELCDKAWELFKTIESHDGLENSDALRFLTEQIDQKRQQRIELYEKGKKTMIGFNKFPDIENRSVTFKPEESYLGMKSLIIERDVNLTA